MSEWLVILFDIAVASFGDTVKPPDAPGWNKMLTKAELPTPTTVPEES